MAMSVHRISGAARRDKMAARRKSSSLRRMPAVPRYSRKAGACTTPAAASLSGAPASYGSHAESDSWRSSACTDSSPRP